MKHPSWMLWARGMAVDVAIEKALDMADQGSPPSSKVVSRAVTWLNEWNCYLTRNGLRRGRTNAWHKRNRRLKGRRG